MSQMGSVRSGIFEKWHRFDSRLMRITSIEKWHSNAFVNLLEVLTQFRRVQLKLFINPMDSVQSTKTQTDSTFSQHC